MQPDTIVPNPGDPSNLNRYSYARNNPIVYSDPSGHCATGLVVDTAVCAVVGGAAVGGTIVVVGATVLFGRMVVDVAFGSDYTHQALDYAADTATNAWDWIQEELSVDGNGGTIINADPLPESIDGSEGYGLVEGGDSGFLPSPLDAGVDVGISVFPLPEEQGVMVHSANWKDLPKPLHSWGKQMSKLPLKKMKERLETHRGTLSRHERKYADALKRGIRSEEVERMRQEVEFLERLIDKRTK